MNNENRDNLEEQKLAEETLRVLDGQCVTDQDSRTFELGRLLKQSASHDMPESDDELRQMLLAELEGEAAVSAAPPTKTLAPKPVESKAVDRIGRRRMWLGLPAAGLMIAVGGWWLYDSGAMKVAEHDAGAELAEVVERGLKNDKAELREKADPEMEEFSLADDDGQRSGGPGDSELMMRAQPRSIPPLESKPLSFDYKIEERYAREPSLIAGGLFDSKAGQSMPGDQKLPKLSATTKNTVVSVPDGGTVVIGGIKLSRDGQQSQQPGQQGNVQGQGQSAKEALQRYRYMRQGLANRSSRQGKQELPVEKYNEGKNFGSGGGRLGYINGKYATLDDFLEADLDDIYDESKTEQLRGREFKSREQYAPIYENQFVQAAGAAAVSTFSIDVDTASYANMRRFLNSGQMPPRDSVRIEELVNYFQYDYPQPKGDDPFSVNMELATCPWNDTHKLLRVGLKGKEVHVKERPATNVVYLIDVSGSMNSKDKLPLLKRGFQMMTKQLGENDRVSIVTYAGSAGVALEPTTGDKTKTINEAIERLNPGGSTHGSAGIELAYKLAQQHFITGGVNKVILATDGDLNVGVTDDDSLVELIKQKASEGVFLTVLGFGTGNLQDGKLEKLADNGNGHYAYLDSNREAHRVLVQQLSGSLVTIAKDVKIQVEFNPAEVKSYRLIGYENRMLATKDFDDDRKDAGEIGAGHTVTAIYEIEPTNAVAEAFTAPSGMKYQLPGAPVPPQQGDDKLSRQLSEAASSGELATLALRYKKPDENESKRIEFAIKNEDKSFGSASDDFRFAASVAGFGMLLRGSEHAGVSTPAMVFKMASDSIGDDASGYRAEFLDLIRKGVPKDLLLEAVFDRGDAVSIALGGFFDLDGDGVSDLEKLKRMIVRNGGRVVVSHDESGNVTGEIDATTRFFVLGPSPRSGSRKVFEVMAKLKEQAEANSVEIIDLRKLLNWMGIHSDAKIERLDSRNGESTGFEPRSPAEK